MPPKVDHPTGSPLPSSISTSALDPTPPSKKRTRAAAVEHTFDAPFQVSPTSGPSRAAAVGAKKRKAEDQRVGGHGKRPVANAPVPRQPVASGSLTQRSSRTDAGPSTTRAAPRAPLVCDDTEGNYIIREDELLHGRYRVVKKLGEGTYGQVAETVDTTSQKSYAVKIIKARPAYREASRTEIRVLAELKRADPTNEHKCIHLIDSFDHRNHVCLVFDLLGPSLYDVLQDNSFAPYPLSEIQDIARQIFTSVAFLHSLGAIHTDLKPDNLLLADSSQGTVPGGPGATKKRSLLNSTDVRLIDYGSATFDNEVHPPDVASPYYQAPEITCGLPWSFPSDVFSIGCILMELFTGQPLFPSDDALERLAMMDVTLGHMPDHFMDRAVLAKPDFFTLGKINFPSSSTASSSADPLIGVKHLKSIISPASAAHIQFKSLVTRLLRHDPDMRPTASDALDHEFFETSFSPPSQLVS